MNIVFASTVDISELLHVGCLCVGFVASTALIPHLQGEDFKGVHHKIHVGHDCLSQHGLNNFLSDILVPDWVVVVVGSVEELGDDFGAVFCHVGFHQDEDDSCVEKLCYEDASGCVT